MSNHGHKFHGDQCIVCGIMDHAGSRMPEVIKQCPGGSRFAPTVLVEVLAREVRELRALVTPSDPGSLPRDVPVLGTTPVVERVHDSFQNTTDKVVDVPIFESEYLGLPPGMQVTFKDGCARVGLIDPLAHLSPSGRESARLNEALEGSDVMKRDLRWRFEVTNPDGTPVSEEECQEFVRKAVDFANRLGKRMVAFTG